VQFALDSWRRFDRCPATPTVDSTSAVVHRTYSPCANATAVELYAIIGGGHSWPKGDRLSRVLDAPSNALDASRVVWELFAAHPKQR
jgi:polyhydroxybutyrate depolymerase